MNAPIYHPFHSGGRWPWIASEAARTAEDAALMLLVSWYAPLIVGLTVRPHLAWPALLVAVAGFVLRRALSRWAYTWLPARRITYSIDSWDAFTTTKTRMAARGNVGYATLTARAIEAVLLAAAAVLAVRSGIMNADEGRMLAALLLAALGAASVTLGAAAASAHEDRSLYRSLGLTSPAPMQRFLGAVLNALAVPVAVLLTLTLTGVTPPAGLATSFTSLGIASAFLLFIVRIVRRIMHTPIELTT